MDLYYALVSKNFVIDDSILKLIKVPISAEVRSYVSVFIGVLQRLRVDNNYDIIEKLVIATITSLDKRHGRTRSNYWRINDLINAPLFKHVIQVRTACEIGVSSMCAFLYDFKSPEEISAILNNVATRIPKENTWISLNMQRKRTPHI